MDTPQHPAARIRPAHPTPFGHAGARPALHLPPPSRSCSYNTMTSDSPSGGRRRARRPRNPRRSRTRSSQRTTPTPQPPPKPLTFWQKIVAFFTGKSPAKPAEPPASPTAAAGPSSPRRRRQKSASQSEAASTSEFPADTSPAPEPRRASRSGLRRPEPTEVTTPRLYVGNLSYEATESDLFELFSGVGSVQNVEIIFNKATLKSKGFGFVQMLTVEEARRAVAELHDKDYMGRKLVVSGAKLDERRPDRSEEPRASDNTPAPDSPSDQTTPAASTPAEPPAPAPSAAADEPAQRA